MAMVMVTLLFQIRVLRLPNWFSAIEVFYGSVMVFSLQNKTIQRLIGKIVGTTVEIIDDINNDGMDELMVQELR